MAEDIDPGKVMVNGHAIGLLRDMFSTLREDLKETEARLSAEIADRFATHDGRHEGEAALALHRHEKTSERLTAIEALHRDQEIDRARHAGQWSSVRAVYTFLGSNAKTLLALAGLATGFLVGFAGRNP